LADGAAERALHTLDEHDRRFPSGPLSIEARVLRIEALACRGDIARASRLAEAFLAQNPASAHAARVRSLLFSLRNPRLP
jgi:outer membrane protein assembly factor BamD (BamD/ComL family)